MLHVLFTSVLLLMLSQPVLAEEREFSIYQGVISSTEGMPKYLIVNEREIPLSGDVKVKDPKEKEVSLSDLKAGKWVYIVSEASSDGLVAKRIYLLPKYIKKGEKADYPFMKKEEEGK